MSYRCQNCNVVCEHPQLRLVTERRLLLAGEGWQIAREMELCKDCYADLSVNVPPAPEARSNGARSRADDDTPRTWSA